MLIQLISFANLVQPLTIVQDELHPAFIKQPEQFASVWKVGEQDAKKKADSTSRLNRFRRGIGNIRVNALRSETVSWVWYMPPEFYAYDQAYKGTKQFWSEEELGPIKAKALPSQPVVIEGIHFYGSILLYPSFGGAYGRIDRYADPKDLSDVRVVLKVGKRILQPVTQPGDMLQHKETERNLFSIPQYQYSTTHSQASGSAYGSGGYAYGSASGTSTTVSSYMEHFEEGYSTYEGAFSVEFRLRDTEGKPLITPKDKEIELIVIYGKSEKHATYKLSDIENPIK